MRFILKTVISALIISAVSEIGKRSSAFAAILAALPMTSLMTMLWLYSDTKDTGKVADLSINIFWAILPSFLFLLSLPILLRNGVRFEWAMTLSCVLMLIGYMCYISLLKKFGISF